MPVATGEACPNPASIVMWRAGLAGLCVLPVTVLALGLDDISERYGLAFLYPAALVLLLQAARYCVRGASRLISVSALVAVIIISIRLIQGAVGGPPFCNSCRQYIPYTSLRNELVAAGYGAADLVAMNDLTAGNLRRLLRRAKVRSAHLPAYFPPGMGAGRCVFIWSEDIGPTPPQTIRLAIQSASLQTVIAPWPRDRGRATPRQTVWQFGEIAPDDPLKKFLCG